MKHWWPARFPLRIVYKKICHISQSLAATLVAFNPHNSWLITQCVLSPFFSQYVSLQPYVAGRSGKTSNSDTHFKHGRNNVGEKERARWREWWNTVSGKKERSSRLKYPVVSRVSSPCSGYHWSTDKLYSRATVKLRYVLMIKLLSAWST